MNEPQISTMRPLLRLIYLLSIAVFLFFIQSAPILGAILLFQLILWQVSGLKWSLLARSLKRLGLFFLIIVLSYAFIETGASREDQWIELYGISINLSGLILAGTMCLRVFTLVLVSLWVQNVSKQGEFVASLKKIGMPVFLSVAIDVSLVLLTSERKGGGGSGKGKGGNKGHHKRAQKTGTPIVFKQLRRGDISFLYEMIEKALARTEDYISRSHPDISRRDARDIAIIAGMTIAMMGLKFLQLMPGLPIAPGHKNLLMLPMFLLAAQLTYCRFGGLWTGITLGTVSFLFGFGKYGVLEILQFAVPGLLADLLLPITKGVRARWARVTLFAVIGGILGLGRFSANLGVLILAGTPFVAVIALLPMLLSQVLFGTLSGVVSAYILGRKFSASTDVPPITEDQKKPGSPV